MPSKLGSLSYRHNSGHICKNLNINMYACLYVHGGLSVPMCVYTSVYDVICVDVCLCMLAYICPWKDRYCKQESTRDRIWVRKQFHRQLISKEISWCSLFQEWWLGHGIHNIWALLEMQNLMLHPRAISQILTSSQVNQMCINIGEVLSKWLHVFGVLCSPFHLLVISSSRWQSAQDWTTVLSEGVMCSSS